MAEDHRDFIERMTDHWEADRTNREDALSDQKFRAGDQWEDAVRKQRETDGRPVLTINRMGQFIKRVSGSLRQSHPAIIPIPVDMGADEQLTEIIAGLIRHIEYQSEASVAYAYGAECAIGCGIGWWQIKTDYVNGAFDQDICIERILDPLSVIVDAKSCKLDRSDADEIYVTEWVSKRDRKKRWPKAAETAADLPINRVDGTYSLYWQTDDRTRIASRWWREKVSKTLGMTANGEVYDLTDMKPNDIVSLGIVRERKADDYAIKHQVFDGSDMLTDVQDWAGRYIPLVPVVGEEVAFDGNVIRHGIIRWAKDPQRLYNYWRSAAAEMIALAPKAPFIVPMKSIAGLEHFWNRANSANLPYLPYNPVPPEAATGDHRPQRARGAEPPAAMWQEAQVAQDDMKATTGIYDASLGAQGNETSGVAIDARTQESDTGTFVYFDNFNHAIKRTGTILVDLIPRIYDGERIVRLLGEDGAESFVPINKVVMGGPDGPMLVNDLSVGTYDVRIKTGPSYASAKEVAKKELGELVRTSPEMMGVLGDLYIESLDLPAQIGGKLAERIKKTIPPQILGEEGGGMPQPPPDPRIEEAMNLDLELKEAEVAKKRGEADALVLENEAAAAALGLHGEELTPQLPNPGGAKPYGASGAKAPQPAQQPPM
jgi:hypothetical protein